LGLYLGELFVLLGAGFTLAAKLSWAVGLLAGAWGMYALVGHWLAAHPVTRSPAHSLRLLRTSWPPPGAPSP
jgi:hypothetical protein